MWMLSSEKVKPGRRKTPEDEVQQKDSPGGPGYRIPSMGKLKKDLL